MQASTNSGSTKNKSKSATQTSAEEKKNSNKSTKTAAGTSKISSVTGTNKRSGTTKTTGEEKGTGLLTDQQRITDLMFCEKKMQENYSSYASECMDAKLRDDFLRIMNKSHLTQYDLFSKAQERGWYKPKAAQAADIKQAYNKFSAMQSSMQ